MACSNSNLCKALKEMSERTWRSLLACRTNRYQLGEESITDFNLLRLVEKTKGVEVTVNKFTKAKEAVTGADWEWWLVGPSGRCLGFRVQAKVLDLAQNRFSHLHYRNAKTGVYQLDSLIVGALSGSPATIPFVCLYTHLYRPRRLVAWPCGRSQFRAQLLGCAMVPALGARALRSSPDPGSARAVMPGAFPMHCLLCCDNYGGKELPDRALAFWKAEMAPAEIRMASVRVGEGDEDIRKLASTLREGAEFIQRSLPDYVASLSARRWPGQPSNDDTSESGLAGVVIFRELPSEPAKEEG